MAYLLFRRRPNASQAFNNFRISSAIAEKCEGDRKLAEKMLAKTYYKSISKAAASDRKTVVPILPPSGNKLWSWNRSFEIACFMASQWCDNEIPLLVPEEADIIIGTEMMDMDEEREQDILEQLDVAFAEDEDDDLDFASLYGDDEEKPKWLIEYAGSLDEMEAEIEEDPGVLSEERASRDEWQDEPEEIDEIIAGVSNTFAEWLSTQIEERNITAAKLARQANMLSSTVVRLSKGIIVVPTKSQILAIACAFGLDREELDEMLARAGYCLSPNVPRDMIVAYYVDHGMYDIGRINRTLFLHGIPTLGTHRTMPR